MKTSESVAELMPDLVKAQLKLKNPVKTESAQAGTRTYQYVDLAGLRDNSADILAQHNLCIVQTTEIVGENFFLITRLYHKSGQWIESDFPLPTNVKSQDYGSAMTYARRYSWAAIIGLHGDKDNDGKEGTVPAVVKAFSKRSMDPLSEPGGPSARASRTPYDDLKAKMDNLDHPDDFPVWWDETRPTRNNQLNPAFAKRLFIETMKSLCNVADDPVSLTSAWTHASFRAWHEQLRNVDASEADELDKLYTVTLNGFNLTSG